MSGGADDQLFGGSKSDVDYRSNIRILQYWNRRLASIGFQLGTVARAENVLLLDFTTIA